MKPNYDIVFLPHAIKFLDNLNHKAREKVYFNIKKSIWEFRTLHNGSAYRLFAFWDKSSGTETLVIATHGIIKKKQKTPTNEIRKAENIRIAYLKFREKRSDHGKQ
jgi:phage-related protein